MQDCAEVLSSVEERRSDECFGIALDPESGKSGEASCGLCSYADGGDEAAEDPVSEEEEVKTLPRVDGGEASGAAARADETMRTDLRRPIEGEVSEEKRLKSDDAMLSELMGSQAAASSGQSGGAQMVDDQDDPGSPVKKPRVACVGFYPPMFAGV